MIVEAVIKWIVSGFTSLLAMLPDYTAPDFVATAITFWTGVLAAASGMSQWINFPAISTAALFIGGATVTAITLKIFRMIVSLASGGGGSAA